MSERKRVVLDIPDEHVEFITGVLRQARHVWTNNVADQIEAQTKPPRIPEPGWGEQVIAHTKYTEPERWVATKNGPWQEWHSESGGKYRWSELIDPVLIREGVES